MSMEDCRRFARNLIGSGLKHRCTGTSAELICGKSGGSLAEQAEQFQSGFPHSRGGIGAGWVVSCLGSAETGVGVF